MKIVKYCSGIVGALTVCTMLTSATYAQQTPPVNPNGVFGESVFDNMTDEEISMFLQRLNASPDAGAYTMAGPSGPYMAPMPSSLPSAPPAGQYTVPGQNSAAANDVYSIFNIDPNAQTAGVAQQESRMPDPYRTSKITVINGDTLLLDDKFKVKLKHIEAPSEAEICPTDNPYVTYACGEDSKQALAKMIDRVPHLICSESEDYQGAFTAQCKAGNTDLSEQMLKEGWAAYVPSDKSSLFHHQAEDEARSLKRGLWKFNKTYIQ